MTIDTFVCDDQDDVRMLVTWLIDEANHGLCVSGDVASGQELIEAYRKVRPMVIVLDQNMPGMSGLDAARAILAENPEQLVLLLTAYLDADLQSQAMEVGIAECLSKDRVHELPDRLRALVQAA